jgi:LAO/AO transport system kinase
MKANKTIAELIDDIRLDSVIRIRSAARLMTLAEESSAKTIEILSALSSDSMPRIILGITGAPGSGKSLFTGRLIAEFCARYPNQMIGVIAVDPSSPFSGGAILGDRIRMMEYADSDNVFIRSLATHGQIGGVTQGTRAITAIMGALGADVVLIETVGVGQMEFAVREVSDAVAIILAPGQGDTIQFLKAGLMEIGDIFVVNKSDRPDALQFYAQLVQSFRITDCVKGRIWNVPVHMTSARDNIGVSEFFDSLEKIFSVDPLWWKAKRLKQTEMLIRRAIVTEAIKQIETTIRPGVMNDILKRKISLSCVVKEVIESMQ